MLKVCLVEDDPGSRDVLGTWFQCYDKIELIAAFETGEQALKELPGKTPDVVLMDIRLPGISGVECVEALRRASPPFHSRILMLTDHQDADWIFSAFRAGADGYLLKADISPRELEAAILQVLADGGPMSPHVGRKVIANFQEESRENSSTAANRMTDSAGLSARQREVLELTTRGLTYKEMASRLGILPGHGSQAPAGNLSEAPRSVALRSSPLRCLPPARGPSVSVNRHYPKM